MSGYELEAGHPGNRVWVADIGDEWCVLAAAPDRRTARRLAYRYCVDLSIMDPSDILLDLRLHLWRRPDGSTISTDMQGAADSEADYTRLGFASDEEYTWYIADGRPKEES